MLGTGFIPKQHLLLHYARVIRFQEHCTSCQQLCEHQQNNGCRSVEHHQFLCRQENTYKDEYFHGHASYIDIDFLNEYKVLLVEAFGDDETYETLKWFRCNNYMYKNGLVISHQSNLYEITQILYVQKQ